MMLRALVSTAVLATTASGAVEAQVGTLSLALARALGSLPPTMSVRFLPSQVGSSPDGRRAAYELEMLWTLQPEPVGVQLGMDVGQVWTPAGDHGWSGLSATLAWPNSRFSPSVTMHPMMGAGIGARRAHRLIVGGESGTLRFEVRSSWFKKQFEDTIYKLAGRPLPQRIPDLQYTDAELVNEFTLGRFGLGLGAGARFGVDHGRRFWSYGKVTMPLWRSLRLAATGGWRPSMPDQAVPEGGFIQFSFSASKTFARHLPGPDLLPMLYAERRLDGRLRLIAHERNARNVRLKGDLTNWEPVAFMSANGRWEIELDAPPGVYLINISIDWGDWTVPRGMLAVADEFGGTAGLLTVH